MGRKEKPNQNSYSTVLLKRNRKRPTFKVQTRPLPQDTTEKSEVSTTCKEPLDLYEGLGKQTDTGVISFLRQPLFPLQLKFQTLLHF